MARYVRGAGGVLPWLGLWLSMPASALAHATERGIILLLPTDLYIGGGAAVVALTFALMAAVPAAGLRALERARRVLGPAPDRAPLAPGAAMLVVVAALVAAGYWGNRDPLSNQLPLMLWTIWWVALTFLHAIFGNLWAFCHPWLALHRLLTVPPFLRCWRRAPPLSYPEAAGYWPAVALFLAFAWFELVHPAPQDPALLANAVIVYFLITAAGTLLFGLDAWLRHGEIFSIFFRIVSWLSPFGAGREGGRRVVFATVPGIRLLDAGAFPASGVAFILLALSSVSFDGFSRTFFWLDLVGVNPLEYPGRTALVGINTLGLAAVFAALVGVYCLAVAVGHALARSGVPVGTQLRCFVVAIAPIAFGYHFAHYLPELLLDSQFALRALSDPFALGWDLIGARDMHVHASVVTNRASIELIWKLQVVGIVAAHVVAVAIAHFLAIRLFASTRAAVLSQIPMTVLMIGYTMFGLWLLSTPAAG